MGINLILYKIIDRHYIEPLSGQKIFRVEREHSFDSDRFAGDDEFLRENEFEYISEEGPDAWVFKRPQDFAQTRQWVNGSGLVEGNKQRLLGLLDQMEQDDSLWLHVSY